LETFVSSNDTVLFNTSFAANLNVQPLYNNGVLDFRVYDVEVDLTSITSAPPVTGTGLKYL